MKVKLDEGAIMPTTAHATDAGFDLYATHDYVIAAYDSIIIHTGVHVEIPHGTVGFLKSKSGLNIKYGITSEGVIDEGYTGEIVVKLQNNSDEYCNIERGQKITQLVILPILKPDIEIVEELADTERGAGGFGSTGK